MLKILAKINPFRIWRENNELRAEVTRLKEQLQREDDEAVAVTDPSELRFLGNLQKEIQKRGLKHTFIAKKVGISPPYLSLILSGKRTPKKQSIIRRIERVITGNN